MKIAFIGFGKVAESSLEMLIRNALQPVCVIVPTGKNFESINNICKNKKIPIIQSKNGAEVGRVLSAFPSLDIVVIASFPYLLPKNALSISKYGAINIHGSLLPKYRGYHPVHWAIINNEKETGVTLHYVDEFADSGDLIAQKRILIKDTDDINSLIDKISEQGSKLLLKVLNRIKNRKHMRRKKQSLQDVTFAPKRYPKDGRINWNTGMRDIFNLIRALKFPYTNAFFLDKNNNQIRATDVFVPKKSGKVIAQIGEYNLITTRDGVILIKTDKELRIGDELI